MNRHHVSLSQQSSTTTHSSTNSIEHCDRQRYHQSNQRRQRSYDPSCGDTERNRELKPGSAAATSKNLVQPHKDFKTRRIHFHEDRKSGDNCRHRGQMKRWKRLMKVTDIYQSDCYIQFLALIEARCTERVSWTLSAMLGFLVLVMQLPPIFMRDWVHIYEPRAINRTDEKGETVELPFYFNLGYFRACRLAHGNFSPDILAVVRRDFPPRCVWNSIFTGEDLTDFSFATNAILRINLLISFNCVYMPLWWRGIKMLSFEGIVNYDFPPFLSLQFLLYSLLAALNCYVCIAHFRFVIRLGPSTFFHAVGSTFTLLAFMLSINGYIRRNTRTLCSAIIYFIGGLSVMAGVLQLICVVDDEMYPRMRPTPSGEPSYFYFNYGLTFLVAALSFLPIQICIYLQTNAFFNRFPEPQQKASIVPGLSKLLQQVSLIPARTHQLGKCAIMPRPHADLENAMSEKRNSHDVNVTKSLSSNYLAGLSASVSSASSLSGGGGIAGRRCESRAASRDYTGLSSPWSVHQEVQNADLLIAYGIRRPSSQLYLI